MQPTTSFNPNGVPGDGDQFLGWQRPVQPEKQMGHKRLPLSKRASPSRLRLYVQQEVRLSINAPTGSRHSVQQEVRLSIQSPRTGSRHWVGGRNHAVRQRAQSCLSRGAHAAHIYPTQCTRQQRTAASEMGWVACPRCGGRRGCDGFCAPECHTNIIVARDALLQ